jgi:predicted GNAT superfamily acetyltransferase
VPNRDQEEQDRRIELAEAQLAKITFDMEAWKKEQATRERALTRQTLAIIVSAAGMVVGAFAAGAVWATYFAHLR